MADTKRDGDVFDFFGLAREMRDLIYQELPAPKRQLDDESYKGLTVFAENFPAANLLLINQQFKQEYLDSLEKLTRIVVEDHLTNVDEEHWPVPRVSTRFAQTHRLHFRIFAACYGADVKGTHPHKSCEPLSAELFGHGVSISRWVARLPHLRSIHIDMHIRPHSSVDECKRTVARHHAKLTSLSKLSRLDVYYNDFDHNADPECFDYSKGQGPVMTWKAESGIMEDLNVEPNPDKVMNPEAAVEPEAAEQEAVGGAEQEFVDGAEREAVNTAEPETLDVPEPEAVDA
ncbi:hypothetical protein LTR08_006569 [Meristemomyces frigidus]|nr:hypothetical protein LTR08_006569 [Meristemomyces frigidus]